MRTIKELIALTGASGETLSEIRLAVVGVWSGHSKGTFSIDEGDIERMVSNFDKRHLDLVIDYEHQTLSDQIAPAAGWIKELFIQGGELWGRVSWTERAKNFIKNGEYKYLSPVFEFGAIDEKSGAWQGCTLHSAALTNKPFLDELGEVVANKNQVKEKTVKTNVSDSAQSENSVREEGLSREARGANAVGDNALAFRGVSGIGLQEAASPERKGGLGSPAQSNLNAPEFSGELNALKSELDALKSENAALKKELSETKVNAAIVANKLPASQKEWALKYAALDPAGFDEFISQAAPLAPTAPANDMFANKSSEPLDVVKLALGE